MTMVIPSQFSEVRPMIRDDIDAALETLRGRASGIRSTIEGYREQIVTLQCDLAGAEGEIRGLERARDMTPAPGEADPPQRHSVQRPVMKLLREIGSGNFMTEAQI